jgi:hypothetical protein
MNDIDNNSIAAFKVSGVHLQQGWYRGEQAYQITMPAAAYQHPDVEILTDRAMPAWLPVDFADGTIELDLASTLAADAPGYAKGFIGVAFRIDAELRFEGLYLRPTNSQSDDQVRRNHSVQYFSYLRSSTSRDCGARHRKNTSPTSTCRSMHGYTSSWRCKAAPRGST